MIILDEQLKTVLRHIERLQLGQGLAAVENFLLTYSYPQESERLTQLQEDYRRMVDYWQRGFKDDRREVVFYELIQRLYRLTADLVIATNVRQSPFVMNVWKRVHAARTDWSLTAVRSELESFVSDQALLELKPQHKRVEEEQQLYDRHQVLINDLFDHIWTSQTWSENNGDAFIDMLLSPTIDSNDQQLLVSAVMLSLLNVFDYQKERVLMEVYRQTTDQHVRQRALVGWVLSFDYLFSEVYPEMNTQLQQLLSDTTCRQELKELQIQLVYCLKTEEDSRKAQQEMFSEIMKNNDQFRFTRNGIEEVDEDALEDILHPEASEQRMEKLEAAVRKMVDMQRAGSDIYFTGFVQMKRFPFFNDICNWFMPFYAKHPALRQTMSDERRSRILLGMLQRSPFCDSDSYSFALGFMQSIGHLPEKLLELLDSGELQVLGDQMDSGSREEPAFIRRACLQDMFRFYRLFPSRSVFVSPFDGTDDRLFFFTNSSISNTPLVTDCVEVAAFLAKQHLYEKAFNVLSKCTANEKDERFYLLSAAVIKHLKAANVMLPTIKLCYQMVLKDNPEHEGAQKGLARVLFTDGNYQEALEIYEQLLSHYPNHQHYLLNKAVCLGRLQRYEEALEILFKLNYEQPDNRTVNSTLAWTLVGAGKLEQAAKKYEKLMLQSELQGSDLLNSGFCQWLMGNVTVAVEIFKRYNSIYGNSRQETLSFEEEAELLKRHGISDVEIRLMTDMIRG